LSCCSWSGWCSASRSRGSCFGCRAVEQMVLKEETDG
jgi:hypothetical protein